MRSTLLSPLFKSGSWRKQDKIPPEITQDENQPEGLQDLITGSCSLATSASRVENLPWHKVYFPRLANIALENDHGTILGLDGSAQIPHARRGLGLTVFT